MYTFFLLIPVHSIGVLCNQVILSVQYLHDWFFMQECTYFCRNNSVFGLLTNKNSSPNCNCSIAYSIQNVWLYEVTIKCKSFIRKEKATALSLLSVWKGSQWFSKPFSKTFDTASSLMERKILPTNWFCGFERWCSWVCGGFLNSIQRDFWVNDLTFVSHTLFQLLLLSFQPKAFLMLHKKQ